MLHMNYYYDIIISDPWRSWHRARDRDYTTRAYVVAREPGWAHFARLGANRTGGADWGVGVEEKVCGVGDPALGPSLPGSRHLKVHAAPPSLPPLPHPTALPLEE